jgi:hypothetical protein
MKAQPIAGPIGGHSAGRPGTSGVLARGGFETFAWGLSTELARRGHRVTFDSDRGRPDESCM